MNKWSKKQHNCWQHVSKPWAMRASLSTLPTPSWHINDALYVRLRTRRFLSSKWGGWPGLKGMTTSDMYCTWSLVFVWGPNDSNLLRGGVAQLPGGNTKSHVIHLCVVCRYANHKYRYGLRYYYTNQWCIPLLQNTSKEYIRRKSWFHLNTSWEIHIGKRMTKIDMLIICYNLRHDPEHSLHSPSFAQIW